MDNLFLQDSAITHLNVHPMYKAIRDLDCYQAAKEKLELIYKENNKYLGDPIVSFKNNLVEQFEDTMWHLCLLHQLRKQGFVLDRPPNRGPDIKASKNNQTYWIEAKNSNIGPHVTKLKYDAKGIALEMGIPNDPRVTARLSGAIKTKSEKYLDYIPDPVREDSIKIIAISAHTNERARRDQQGRSYMEVVLHDKIQIVNPSGGSAIELGLFHQVAFDHIDGIIYTALDPLTYSDSKNCIEWYLRK